MLIAEPKSRMVLLSGLVQLGEAEKEHRHSFKFGGEAKLKSLVCSIMIILRLL